MAIKHLGEFEQLLMFALVHLGDGTFSVEIRREIEERTGRQVSPGAVYTALERLESRGLVASRLSETTPARGGRRRKSYRLERDGAVVLNASYQTLSRMAGNLTDRLEVLATGDGA